MEYKNNKLTIIRSFKAPVELVWKALADSTFIKQWSPFFPDFKAEVGFEVRFMLGPDKDHQYMHICKVTEVIKNKRLVYSWSYEGLPGESYVAFDLSAEGTGDMTKMTFTHEITKPFPAADQNFGHGNFIQGWTYTVDTLQKFVEKGEIKSESKGAAEFRITRIFNAPRSTVWKAWTDPEMIMKWWGPKPFTSPVCTVDLRVGGKYLYCMRSPDGKDYWSGGTYEEIVPQERLVYIDTFSDEKGNPVDPAVYGMPAEFPKQNTVTVTFEEAGSAATRLTILYAVESAAVLKKMLEMQMKEGWESSLEKFAEIIQ